MSRSRRRASLALLLVQALACQPIPTQIQGDSPRAPDSPFRASAPGDGLLAFPPPPDAEPRRALPRRVAEAEQTGETPTEVEWPELTEDDRHFEIAGRTLRIHFNREIEPPAEGVEPLTIEPAVDGELSWPSPWVVAFAANAPFDPDTEYTVRLGELYDESGARVSEGWTGVFTAEPRVSIAGKVISYLPDPGRPRSITVRPDAPPRVGTEVAPRILFDQPVTTAQVASRLQATVGGIDRPLELSHPDADLFEAMQVDRRHVIVAQPKTPLRPGETMVFTVLDEHGGVEQEQSYEVADPLAFSTVDCNSYYYDEDTCVWKDDTLSMDGRRFAVRFNNPIDSDEKALAKAVRIEPAVRNLRVRSDDWRSDGVVWISGEFRSSTTYHVRVGKVRDRYGSKLATPLRFSVKVAPQSASVSMPEGQQVLDEAGSRKFTITTRNVEEATLQLWEVEPQVRAWNEARQRLGARERPTEAPDLEIPVRPRARRDRSVQTTVDLLDRLEAGHTYLARLELKTPAFGASAPSYPSWSMAARSPTALLSPHDADALAVHVHAGTDRTLVHVARLADGKPVVGAHLRVDGSEVPGLRTNADGMAELAQGLGDTTAGSRHHVLEVEAARGHAVVALGPGSLDERSLAPELAGHRALVDDLRAMVISDRGVYRPGATVELKGIAQVRERGRLRPASSMAVGLRIHAPTGKEVLSEDGTTNEMGSFVTRFAVPDQAEIGRYRVELVAPERDDAVLARYGIQVAEFEPPRFTVDVEVDPAEGGKAIEASVLGRYLFGAAMEDAQVAWTLRRQPAAFPHGPLTSKGFAFRRVRSWWDDEDDDETWMRLGEGTLDREGRFSVAPSIELADEEGPQRFVLEAEVTDESHRSIAARGDVVLHAAERYAGLKLRERWLDVGDPIPVDVGVIDREGASVTGVPVELRLERLDWKRVRSPGPGGWAHVDWREVSTVVGRCKTDVRDHDGTIGCRLVPRRSGTYRLSAAIDGHEGGSVRLWAWGRGGSSHAPSPGRRVEIVADRDRYRPGDTAELVVRNPFPSATAILTVEQGDILHHETRVIAGGAARFAVKLGPEHAPHAHATVTLLPRGASAEDRVDWKLGAIRLPVELDDNRLEVVVDSDRDRYAPGEAVEIVVDVHRKGAPVAGAEVALAVVDEGVLRLTNFHAADPVPQLYPGQGLELWVDDSRRMLAEQLRRSHVAGDGSGAGSHSLVSTRKNFVKTALWKPQLRTDEKGRAHVRMTLPDNLTRFRMMAVVVDDEGRGGVHEDDFEVQKPLMAIPAVPRFAAVGDHYEAAVLVHNNQEHDETATVIMGAEHRTVEIPAGGRARVAFGQAPTQVGPTRLTFAVTDHGGIVRDMVEATVPVQAPGVDERPRLHGAFLGRQQIALRIPDDVFVDASTDDHLTVMVGQNLWPELGSRVEYLVDYPHGCVEQTTSSTLPLLAAREILPRLGITRFSDDQLRDMIGAGVQRLSTMRTSSGGLAYWPGGYEPNPFGTAYATLAVARAHRLGLPIPEGMLEGIETYLIDMVEADRLPHGYGVEVKAMIALALAELDALPAHRADALYDTADEQGIFGAATLALALSTLPEQDDRVQALLDRIETAFDEEGSLTASRSNDYWYYGSDTRTAAQSTLALHRLRPRSLVLPRLVRRLVRDTGSYTTQATAYGLLALAERIDAADGPPVRQRVLLDGEPLVPDLEHALALGPNVRQYQIPLASLRGEDALLVLESESDQAQSFMISARWRRTADGAQGRAATTQPNGPDLYRVITDVKGRAVDFDAIEPGQVLRVVLLARLPDSLPYDRRGYLAFTDRLPAGFEAMQPDLWTVASVPELDDEHPLYDHLRWTSNSATHVELRDDRAQFYFDRIWGDWVHATYLMRATTPGTFEAPPAMAELMYEPDSMGYSQARSFTVVQ